ncbi:hypothetical protein [Sporomusa sp. KB1]|jgi:hypothetical protein|uniref:hypothetical protein n=1 Tax=Sporomusa sp. KB1 TaxID=943346 RepID=UPI0011A88BF6|nr:hypothetical protein [Sporomusa sp. KB1]TWH49614.1 hypothetical protein Salpa_5853 [Sporomusa sp. KB1]
MIDFTDVSPIFRWSAYDSTVAENMIRLEGTPEAIKYFSEVCEKLTNYAYWFFLSTLWVNYSGRSDIELWKRLFSSERGQKLRSIMKPSELAEYDRLPYFITAYRAHRPEETDWIAYTLDLNIACRFAREREVNRISEYSIKKRDVLALFLRRGEKEILVLDKSKTKHIRDIEIVFRSEKP